MSKTLFAVAVLAVSTVPTVALLRARQQSTAPTAAQGSAAVASRDALRNGGLHDAARAAGGTFIGAAPSAPDAVLADLLTPAVRSDAVIVGKVLDNQCHISYDGKSITTDYRIRILERLGGDVTVEEIVLSVPGGRVQFDDGTAAQINPRDLEMPLNGHRLVLFLRRVLPEHISDGSRQYAGGAEIFRSTFGSLSMFTVSEDQKVKPNTHRSDPVVKKNRDKDAKAFLQEVKQAVAEAEPLKVKKSKNE